MITEESLSKNHIKIKHFLLHHKIFAISNKFVVKVQDKHFIIECSAVEKTSVNQASRTTIERCRLLKKMQHIGFHMCFH